MTETKNTNHDKEEVNKVFFATEHLQVNLKERAVKSTAITISAQAVKLVLQLTFIAILARILSPSDFGLFAMIAVFTGLGTILMEGGLSMATIQREKIGHAQVSNLFWLNIFLGFVIAILAIALSPLVAWIYNEPELTNIMIVMSLTFILGSFYVQHDAILKRQMRFKEFVLIDVVSIGIGGLAGIIAANNGLGYWALVVGPIATTIIKVAIIWYVVKWRPSPLKKGVGTRPLVNFGANLTGANFVNYFTDNATPFSIGLIGGPHFLGLYDRSFRLASIPSKQLLPPIMSVLQTAVSRVATDQVRLKRASLSLMSKVALFTMLVSTIMFVSADWIVLLLLGPGWEEAENIFKLLIIAMIATPIASLTAVILIAIGEGRALFKWKIYSSLILIISLIIGSFYGIYGILIAHVISEILIRLPLFLYYSSKFQAVRFTEFLKVLILPITFSLLVVGIDHLINGYFLKIESFIALLFYLTLLIFIYILFGFLFRSTRNQLIETYDIFKALLKSSNKVKE